MEFFKPRIVKITQPQTGPPPGQYIGIFLGIKDTSNKDYGDGWQWTWAIAEGPHVGATASRTTSTVPSQKNSCGRMACGIAGRLLTVGEEFDIGPYLGKRYQLIVGPSVEGSSTRVEYCVQCGDITAPLPGSPKRAEPEGNPF